MLRRSVVLVGACALLAGCGSDDKAASTAAAPAQSPEQQVESTWRTAAINASKGNGTAFCAKVAPEGKAKLTQQTSLPCEDAVRLLAGQLTPADRAAVDSAKVTSVTVTGDTAVIRYETTPKLARYGFTGQTSLKKSGNGWLLLGI